ncbi:MAG: alpha-amylase [Bacteroides sp.]|nr:alpha-amylase [Bacteroides sp.]
MKWMEKLKNAALWQLLCLFLLSGFVACSDDDSEFQNYLTIAESSEPYFNDGITFEEEASFQAVSFSCGQSWKAVVSNAPWCTVSPSQGEAGTVNATISATKNESGAVRTATITFVTGTISRQLKVTQAAEGKEIVTLKEGLSYSPETPDADAAMTFYYKADKTSELYGYTGDVYVHIGTGAEDTWEHVITEWGKNEAKFKMTKVEDNAWSLSLTPTIRGWFGGNVHITQVCIVIRSGETKSGSTAYYQTQDLFIPVKDATYEAFKPGTVKEAAMPSGLQHGINYVDNSTVTLVLYDKDTNGKHKEYAHVVGDFNNWTLANDETSQMYRDEAEGCWWITLKGLDASKEYAFQYYVGTEADGATRLADAYTEKVLDPDNDKWISASTYSDDMTYPEGARGVVSTFKIQQDTYAWKVADFKIAEPNNLVIYELHLRDFTEDGTLNGAMSKLDYLKELGVNAIELMPVQEFDGNDSWGYNPCFFFAMDKAYGTKKMYKEFIDACHEKGMAVLLDVVYNHATGAHPFAKLYWDSSSNCTAKNNPWFNVSAPHPYSVYHDFNHESDLVRTFVKRNLQFLLKEYNIDGFRFDLTKGFTQNKSTEATAGNYDASRIAILKDYNAAIKEVKPDAFVVLEHFCASNEESELAEDGLHMWNNLNNAYCQSGMAWGENSSFSNLYKSTPNWVGFMESHDEERVGYKQVMWGHYDLQTNLTNRMKQLSVNAAFFLTVPGPKMIWQFGELGYDISINANQSGVVVEGEDHRTGRKPILWDYFENADRKGLYEVYSKLMKLRNDNPELFDEATFSWSVNNTGHTIDNTTKADLSGNWLNGRTLYSESVTGKKLMVLGNFTNATREIALPKEATEGTWNDYMTGAAETIGAKVSVPAHSFVVYTSF